MPQKFKAFASIAAWVLFIFGMISLLMSFITAMVQMEGPAKFLPVKSDIELALSVFIIILSVVAMRLRQKME